MLDLASLSMLIKRKSWDSDSTTIWNGRPRWMLRSKKQTNVFSCLDPWEDLALIRISSRLFTRAMSDRSSNADVVWHSGLTYKQAGDLEHIQRMACRTILGHQFTTYTESIKQCNLDRLSERRVDHCLKFTRGLVDNPRTSHLLPPTKISTHSRNLRNVNNFSQPKIKTNRFKQSPIPYFISLLNKQ